LQKKSLILYARNIKYKKKQFSVGSRALGHNECNEFFQGSPDPSYGLPPHGQRYLAMGTEAAGKRVGKMTWGKTDG